MNKAIGILLVVWGVLMTVVSATLAIDDIKTRELVHQIIVEQKIRDQVFLNLFRMQNEMLQQLDSEINTLSQTIDAIQETDRLQDPTHGI